MENSELLISLNKSLGLEWKLESPEETPETPGYSHMSGHKIMSVSSREMPVRDKPAYSD